jgi:4-hydroxy-3-polyprenylbenzoate decarboxylase
LHVLPNRARGHGPKTGLRDTDSTLLIDATLKAPAPPLALPTREFMEGAKRIWEELNLPRLTPQAPWHGYSLGEWGDDWETFARRAVKGEWEANGREQFARRRSGILPENPVREVEGKKK